MLQLLVLKSNNCNIRDLQILQLLQLFTIEKPGTFKHCNYCNTSKNCKNRDLQILKLLQLLELNSNSCNNCKVRGLQILQVLHVLLQIQDSIKLLQLFKFNSNSCNNYCKCGKPAPTTQKLDFDSNNSLKARTSQNNTLGMIFPLTPPSPKQLL